MIFNKKWILKHKGDIKSSNIDVKCNISSEISQILKNRGIEDEKDAEIFMNPSLKYLRDPFLLKDMEKSVQRIKKAIENNESIWIYGDYDVDGVSSTSILCIYFNSINYKVNYYIPNRLEEGYGINEDAIKTLHGAGCDLLISVDCGITSVKEVDLANELGIDVIITDHHECQSEIPNAYAVINPKQEDCKYPFDMLCGCGVAFKLIQALTPKGIFEYEMFKYLEIVTLATICDVVPLIDENRIIVKNGLNLMKDGVNIGLKELIKVCGIETEKIGSSHIGFAVGPRINASGRLGYSYLGVELFTTDNVEEAIEIANALEEKNNERQMMEAKMYQEAEEIILSNKNYENDKVLVISKEGWQHGIIGIVASKLTEKYYKPTILLTIEHGDATGSARSIKGFSIFDALVESKDLLNKFGGHEQAAGLSLDANNIYQLSKEVNEYAKDRLSEEDLIENINVEFELNEDVINLDLVDELHKLEPYGMANPSPRFVMRDLILKDIRNIGKTKQHLKMTLEKDKVYDCIGFNMVHLGTNLAVGDKVDLLFQLDSNTFMGNTKVQFLLKDIRKSYPKNISEDEVSVKLLSHMVPKDKDNLRQCIDSDFDIDFINPSRKSIFESIKVNSLILTNTISGYYRAISDLALCDYDFDINYIKVDNNNDKVQLIFAPNIDKIDLKRYNNIILYDYLYNMGEYSLLYESKNQDMEIINNYNHTDKLYIENINKTIVPSREEFIYIYKYMISKQEVCLPIIDIKKEFNITPLKVFSILRVFEELSLIKFDINYNESNINIKLLPKPNQKLDLNKSTILKNIQNAFKI